MMIPLSDNTGTIIRRYFVEAHFHLFGLYRKTRLFPLKCGINFRFPDVG